LPSPSRPLSRSVDAQASERLQSQNARTFFQGPRPAQLLLSLRIRLGRRRPRRSCAPTIATGDTIPTGAPLKERILKVEAQAVFVRQMKTKWGSCNPKKATIRFNTDLAKKPLACLEYVLVHELAHLIEPTHSDRFRAILGRHLPSWPHLRNQLNRAPLAHEDWEY
jgi:hypothetical protein